MIGIRNLWTLVGFAHPHCDHGDSRPIQLCSVLFFTASTFSAPGTPNLSPKPDSSASYEASHERSLPAEIDERAIRVSPPYQVVTATRYIALFYDLTGGIRIMTPTLLDERILGLVPTVRDLAGGILQGFVNDPRLTSLPNWRQIGAAIAYPPTPLNNRVVNLSLYFSALPILQSWYNPEVLATAAGLEAALINFIQLYMLPYWAQSPGNDLVGSDPRGVQVVWAFVPDARSVGQAMSYVFNYDTPPGWDPFEKSVTAAQHNVTLAGNSTQVATKVKLTNSTVHLDANLTKRDTFTCSGFHPNLLPFLEGGPITEVGTDTISCAS